jgi:TfoX/Sxy family transcriptional regulator of competence genes
LCGRITRLPTTQRQEWPIGLRRSVGERVRQVLAGCDDAEEKRMFGGLCFMVGGRMCCGVHKSHLILRLPVDEALVFRPEGCDPLLSEGPAQCR